MAEQDRGPEEVREPGTTGRYVVTIDPTATQQGLDVLEQQARVSADATAGGDEGITTSQLDAPEASVLFPDLGILIAGGLSAEQVRKIQALTEEDNPILAIEPERRYDALHSAPDSYSQ
jgi:phosphoribosylanthranilate isomerase